MFYLMLESAFPPKNSPVLLSIGLMLYMKSLTKGLKMIKKHNNRLDKIEKNGGNRHET